MTMQIPDNAGMHNEQKAFSEIVLTWRCFVLEILYASVKFKGDPRV